MRDYKKVIDKVINDRNASNESILNSSGLNPGMSVDEIRLEYTSLNAIKTLSDSSLIELKQVMG